MFACLKPLLVASVYTVEGNPWFEVGGHYSVCYVVIMHYFTVCLSRMALTLAAAYTTSWSGRWAGGRPLITGAMYTTPNERRTDRADCSRSPLFSCAGRR